MFDWIYENYKIFMSKQDRFYRNWLKEHELPDDTEHANALAHGYMSAVLAYHFGGWAAEIMGDAKELLSEDPDDTAKDQFNNEVGRRLGLQAAGEGFNDNRIDDLLDNALRNGHLALTPNDNRIEGGHGSNKAADHGQQESSIGFDDSQFYVSSLEISLETSGGENNNSVGNGMITTPMDGESGEPLGPSEMDDHIQIVIGEGNSESGDSGGSNYIHETDYEQDVPHNIDNDNDDTRGGI